MARLIAAFLGTQPYSYVPIISRIVIKYSSRQQWNQVIQVIDTGVCWSYCPHMVTASPTYPSKRLVM